MWDLEEIHPGPFHRQLQPQADPLQALRNKEFQIGMAGGWGLVRLRRDSRGRKGEVTNHTKLPASWLPPRYDDRFPKAIGNGGKGLTVDEKTMPPSSLISENS